MQFYEEVLSVIAKRMECRKAHLGQIAKTGYSFEEWFNWEAFLSCIDSELNASPKPLYSKYNLALNQKAGDLLVENESRTILIEIGIVHDWTGDKWIEKLEGDREKLLNAKKNASDTTDLIQFLVLLSSNNNFMEDPKWFTWLDRLSFWKNDTSYSSDFLLSPNGKMVLKAWRV